LSLFGDDARRDHRSLTRDSHGRRINSQEFEQSLVLLKPTGKVAHEGGLRFEKESWAYDLLKQWLVEGARHQPGTGEVVRLEVTPKEHRFVQPNQKFRPVVEAIFRDGTREEITRFCDFKLRDDSIAELDSDGLLTSRLPGDTTLIISYRGQIGTVSLLFPHSLLEGVRYPELDPLNSIDREVFRRLKLLNRIPSEMSDDAEFLRRVHLDTIGKAPTPQEVRDFLQDQRIDKRLRKIDELIHHPLHAALWAMRWSDITGNRIEVMEGSPEQRAKQSKMWHDWLRLRFQENRPWDETARNIITATSREGREIRDWMRLEAGFNDAPMLRVPSDYADRKGLDLYWRRVNNDNEFFPIEQMAELTATAFMGVRIDCAQCHKHPFDRWTQSDYRSFANLFGQLKYGRSNEQISATARILEERRAAGNGELPFPRIKELFLSNVSLRKYSHPETREPLQAKILGGPEVQLETDAREQFADWLVRPDNPFFARSFVNRLWAHYFGIGMVDPVDHFSLANPPSNEGLLNLLAEEFTRSGFNIRHLERLILTSRTYQLSSRSNETNARDQRNFSHAQPRKMLAEVMIDLLNDTLETHLTASIDIPAGSRAIEIAPNRLRDGKLDELFRIFGRPQRGTACDCERPRDITLSQMLFLMSESELLKKIESGRLNRLLASSKSDREIVEELYLALLGRFPTETDLRLIDDHLKATPDRPKAFQDLLWALLNTKEFVLNH
jgi:hypothetical protein